MHVDAHADFVDELDGARLTGASQLRRLAELPSWARSPRSGFAMSSASRWTGCESSGGAGRLASTCRARRRRSGSRDRPGDRGAVGLDRPRRARLLDRTRALATGAGRAQLPAAAGDLGRSGATRSRDRLRRRRVGPGARPVRSDVARGEMDCHALPQRDLRSAALDCGQIPIPLQDCCRVERRAGVLIVTQHTPAPHDMHVAEGALA